jgi:hypothetical protein
MISQVSEKKMHLVRWVLAIGWLTLILSLFYDPISLWLTDPNNLGSPVHLHPEKCIKLQGICLEQHPYALGARIFWSLIVPLGLIILIVFGHEFWRRICPLYFFSQIPRALGIQRKRKIVNPDTGSIRYELAGVEPESWLGRNRMYVQFGLFYLGLNIRLLFVNGSSIALGIFLTLTILSSITVGYLLKGRSWCQYFCPMASVQMFYTAPRGLLGSDAHLSPPQSITQSMCRTTEKSGKEKSACVSCQSPCIDIDAERSYWEGITKPDQKFLFYSYFGLMFGFFFYFFLYSGNWDYYYSGAWSHEYRLLNTLFNPGFYIFNQAIPIPKILAVPLTLAVFIAISYFGCQTLENLYRAYLKRKNKSLSEEQILHTCFVLCVFAAFNVFFMFGGRPNLALLPTWLVLVFNSFIAISSSLWLYRSINRSKEIYSRESLATSLRRQLNKLAIDWGKFLEGRSLENLIPDEVYVLAKVLPGFNRTDRLRVYKGVLQEALEDGKIQSANSLEVLKDLRQELSVNDEEHYSVLTELGIEDPSLLDPQKQLTRENKLRIESYRRGLELLVLELVESGISLQEAFERKQKQIITLKQEYAITPDEQEQVLAELFNQDGTVLQTAEILLSQLQNLAVCHQALSNLVSLPQSPVHSLLRSSVKQKQKLVTNQLISILEILGDSPKVMSIASSVGILAANIMPEILAANLGHSPWEERLSPAVIKVLQQVENTSNLSVTNLQSTDATRIGVTDVGVPVNSDAIVDVLLQLLEDIDPLVQAASLYALHQIKPAVGVQQAHQLIDAKPNLNWLLKETAARILGQGQHEQVTTSVPTLIAKIKVMERIEEKTFEQPIIRVGRSQDNDIIISDSRISRQHAIFYLDGQGVSVKDLGSTNGIRIGTNEIRNQEQQLKQGDIVTLSAGDEISIVVGWKVQSTQLLRATDSLGTLEKLLWLYESSFFQGVGTSALIELAQNSQVRIYQAGEKIYDIGTPAAELLLLIDGQAEVRHQGSENAIATISPGQTTGELAVLNHTKHSFTAIATQARTKILAITAKDFEVALAGEPLLARNLLVMMSNRVQASISQ